MPTAKIQEAYTVLKNDRGHLMKEMTQPPASDRIADVVAQIMRVQPASITGRGRVRRAIAITRRETSRVVGGMEMQEQATETVHAVREQAAALAKEIADQAAAKAVTGAARAREVGSTLAAETTSRVRDVEQKVGEEVVPTLREIALQAASVALDLWQTAREKAGEMADAAQSETAGASHVVGVAEKRAREATSAVIERVEEAGGRAKEASTHAAEATVATGKDTGAALLWGSAAVAVIFYAILSRERREQVLRALDGLFKQAREIIRDFQGYDEEFA
jgi:hypothetical protein